MSNNMADSDFRGSLKEALHETITGCLSGDQEIRLSAEQRLAALEVTEEFGLILTEFVLNPENSMAVRLISSVILNQYVNAHWSTLSEKFHIPEVKSHIKEKIKTLLLTGLSESLYRIRLAIASAISKIAQWEWPENWPGLFDILLTDLKGENSSAVEGAMSVLKEFSRGLTDTQIPDVGEVLVKETYRIFENESLYHIRIRARSVEIFTTIASLIADTELNTKGSIEKQPYLLNALPLFYEKFVHYLTVPNGPTSDCGLKTKIIRSMKVLICKLPKYMANYIQQILSTMSIILAESAKAYQKEQVDNGGEVDDGFDSDCEPINLNNFITATFDFISTINEQKEYLTALDSFLPNIIFYIIFFTQRTQDQLNLWTNDPSQFLREEDPLDKVFRVRFSAKEFLKNCLTYSNEVSVNALCSAITKHVKLVNNPQIPTSIPRNLENNWKIYEACITLLTTAKDPIVELHKAEKLQFDLIGFLNNVVLSNLNNQGVSPLLLGRCLSMEGSVPDKYPPVLSTVIDIKDIHFIIINNAIKATASLCHNAFAPYLNENEQRLLISLQEQCKITEES